MPVVTLDELSVLREADLGTSRWVVVDQARIEAFAEATEDRQWIHVDPERAAVGPFGTTVAHGYLSLSLVSRFLLDLLEVSDAGSAINYGLERVRFPAPVPVGARVRGHAELLDATDVGAAVQTTVRVTVEVEGSAKPAAVADVVSRFLRPTSA